LESIHLVFNISPPRESKDGRITIKYIYQKKEKKKKYSPQTIFLSPGE